MENAYLKAEMAVGSAERCLFQSMTQISSYDVIFLFVVKSSLSPQLYEGMFGFFISTILIEKIMIFRTIRFYTIKLYFSNNIDFSQKVWQIGKIRTQFHIAGVIGNFQREIKKLHNMMKLGPSTKINNVPQNLQPFRPSDMNFPCLNQLKMIMVRWESEIIYKTFCFLDNVQY